MPPRTRSRASGRSGRSWRGPTRSARRVVYANGVGQWPFSVRTVMWAPKPVNSCQLARGGARAGRVREVSGPLPLNTRGWRGRANLQGGPPDDGARQRAQDTPSAIVVTGRYDATYGGLARGSLAW